jgi:Tat protein secretion system quality control protein TatD with DNase activity
MQLPSQFNEYFLEDPEGKAVNHPANIRVVYRELAKFLEESEDRLTKRVEKNFLRLFGGF